MFTAAPASGRTRGDQPLRLLIMSAALFSESAACKLVVTEKSELLETAEGSSPRTSLATDGGLWLFSLRTAEPVGEMSE